MFDRDEFYERMNMVGFHDGHITKYERIDDNIILEFEDDYDQNITTRLTFIDVECNSDIDLVGFNIFACKYDKYIDGYYYIELDVRDRVVVFKTKGVKIEEFVTSKLYKRYENFCFQGHSYKGNILKDDDVIEIMRLVGLFWVKEIFYDKEDVVIKFKKFMENKKCNLIFKNGIVRNYIDGKEVTEDEADRHVKEKTNNGFLDAKIKHWVKIGAWRFRIEDTKDNRIEVGVILSADTEMVITCDDILVDKNY